MRYIELTPETGPLTNSDELTDLYIKCVGPVAGISLVDPGYVFVGDVVIDCTEVPRGHNTHGVRVTGNCGNVVMERVTVIGSSHYGFGFQRVSLPKRDDSISLRSCVSVGSDADGFDFKVIEQKGSIRLQRCLASHCPVGFDIRGDIGLIYCTSSKVKTPVRVRAEGNGINGLAGNARIVDFQYRWKKKRQVRVERGAEAKVEGWERML